MPYGTVDAVQYGELCSTPPMLYSTADAVRCRECLTARRTQYGTVDAVRYGECRTVRWMPYSTAHAEQRSVCRTIRCMPYSGGHAVLNQMARAAKHHVGIFNKALPQLSFHRAWFWTRACLYRDCHRLVGIASYCIVCYTGLALVFIRRPSYQQYQIYHTRIKMFFFLRWATSQESELPHCEKIIIVTIIFLLIMIMVSIRINLKTTKHFLFSVTRQKNQVISPATRIIPTTTILP